MHRFPSVCLAAPRCPCGCESRTMGSGGGRTDRWGAKVTCGVQLYFYHVYEIGRWAPSNVKLHFHIIVGSSYFFNVIIFISFRSKL